MREVSRADGSVGRILDGHLNAVERLLLVGARGCSTRRTGRRSPPDACSSGSGVRIPSAVRASRPRCAKDPDGLRLYGVKTFCSGAGGVQRALVVARDAADGRRLAYVDLASGVSIDRDWYRADGLRASESHRVVFSGARVLALLGGDGEMLREPWFSRDAIRTSATWAGIADGVVAAATSWLRQHGADDQLAGLAAGRMRVAIATIDRWLEYAGRRADEDRPMADTSIEARWAIASACREIIADAATACGSRPLATGGALSRGRRDLDLFLLQHRLEPKLAAHGHGGDRRDGRRMTPPAEADARPPSAASHDRPRVAAAFFEDLYERSEDPWSFATSDYERRKYAHTLSSLGAPRFERALEIGCSIGVFTELLASVTGELVAIDVSERALARARRRLHGRRGVRFVRASFPEEMPAGHWDLIVCSEILYYLDRDAFALAVDRLRSASRRARRCSPSTGARPTRTYPLLGDEVHDRLVATLGGWHALDDRRPQYRLDRFEGR